MLYKDWVGRFCIMVQFATQQYSPYLWYELTHHHLYAIPMNKQHINIYSIRGAGDFYTQNIYNIYILFQEIIPSPSSSSLGGMYLVTKVVVKSFLSVIGYLVCPAISVPNDLKHSNEVVSGKAVQGQDFSVYFWNGVAPVFLVVKIENVICR